MVLKYHPYFTTEIPKPALGARKHFPNEAEAYETTDLLLWFLEYTFYLYIGLAIYKVNISH